MYIINERPSTDSEYVFIKERFKNCMISSLTVSSMVDKIMDVAKIRMNSGDRRGTHIFRHKLATRMLENNVPAPIISNTLGHISSSSLEVYVSTDFTHLKECALSVEKFPVFNETEGEFND